MNSKLTNYFNINLSSWAIVLNNVYSTESNCNLYVFVLLVSTKLMFSEMCNLILICFLRLLLELKKFFITEIHTQTQALFTMFQVLLR